MTVSGSTGGAEDGSTPYVVGQATRGTTASRATGPPADAGDDALGVVPDAAGDDAGGVLAALPDEGAPVGVVLRRPPPGEAAVEVVVRLPPTGGRSVEVPRPGPHAASANATAASTPARGGDDRAIGEGRRACSRCRRELTLVRRTPSTVDDRPVRPPRGIEAAVRDGVERARWHHDEGLARSAPAADRGPRRCRLVVGPGLLAAHVDHRGCRTPPVDGAPGLRRHAQPFEATGASVHAIGVSPIARVHEVAGPGDWRRLVDRFPMDVTGTHDGG